MLSGLTSRCTQPLAFMYASPVAACLKIVMAAFLDEGEVLGPHAGARRLPAGK